MWPNPQETTDLVTFIKEILNGKLNSSSYYSSMIQLGIRMIMCLTFNV